MPGRGGANPWLPVSGCGPACVPPERRGAGTVRVAWRVFALTSILLTLLPAGTLTLATPRPVRVRYWRFTARCGLVAVGLRLDLVDRRPRGARRIRGALMVANHISFFDVLAVAAVSPARFVAKREVLTSGAVGPLLRCFGVLPHRRGALRELPTTLARVSGLLRRGRPVVVFPEGTTWCGRGAGRFRPAFFQAALDTGAPVLPIHIGYHRDGRPVTTPGYLGDDELGDTFRRVLRARGLTVRVEVHPPQPPAGDRRQLAAHCEALIRPDRRHWERGRPRGYPGLRSCPSTSTTPPPPRWSPKLSRR
ncbi:lysophospholipid acyltransferase family protein [Gordonia caeni]|uniref:Lysophospholipid acyltransferase family protein n=1 Tax=Gordonia caeni TaxID=1007097 RepID=A0ABP7NZK9_9ACTN